MAVSTIFARRSSSAESASRTARQKYRDESLHPFGINTFYYLFERT